MKPLEKELDKEIREAFDRVYTRSWYIDGEEDAKFERAFSEYCNTEYCVGTGNGLDALFLSLKVSDTGFPYICFVHLPDYPHPGQRTR